MKVGLFCSSMTAPMSPPCCSVSPEVYTTAPRRAMSAAAPAGPGRGPDRRTPDAVTLRVPEHGGMRSLLLLVALLVLAPAGVASASFDGSNGKVAYVDRENNLYIDDPWDEQ